MSMTSQDCHPKDRPCAVGCEPGKPFVAAKHCHRCWRYAHDLTARLAYGGDSAVYAVAGVKPAKPVAVPPVPSVGGVGTELERILSELGLGGFAGCGCSDRAAAMNRQGPEWVEKNRPTVEAWLREGAAKAGWAAKAKAGVLAAVSGLAFKLNPLDPAPGLLDEALRRDAAKRPPASPLPPTRTVLDIPGLARTPDRGPFNGGELIHNGRRLLAYRVGLFGARVHVAELDAGGRVVRDRRLDLTHPRSVDGQDDPILTTFRGRLRVWFVGAEDKHRKGSQLYADLTDDLRTEAVYHPTFPGINPLWEKNWMPVEHDGVQYAIYTSNPHVVLRIDGDKAEVAYQTPYPFRWHGGLLRGGAPPVPHKGKLLVVTHGKIEPRLPLLYNVGLYECAAEPPFAPTAAVEKPLFWGSDAEAAQLGCEYAVVFPRSARIAGDRLRVVAGEYDTRLVELSWPMAGIEKLLGQ